MKYSFVCILLVSLLVLSGCGAHLIPVHLVQGEGKQAMDETVEQFFASSSSEALKRTVEGALDTTPKDSRSHEMAAILAYLEDAQERYFDHLVYALRDVGNTEAPLHLRMLLRVERGARENAILAALLAELNEAHPNPEIRSMAAVELIEIGQREGEMSPATSLVEETGFYPEFSVIGVWDNDQGKALDTALPPERGSTKTTVMDGLITSATWHTLQQNPAAREIDLAGHLYPSKWVAGYLASTFSSASAEDATIRLSTTSPLRIWHNGRMLFEAREVTTTRPDQFIIPISVVEGRNDLLIKSAQREGKWTIEVRVTDDEGESLAGLKQEPLTNIPMVRPGNALYSPERLLERRMMSQSSESSRTFFLENFWLKEMGQSQARVEALEKALSSGSNSLVLNYEYAMALWNNLETGRTAKQLKKVHALTGGKMALVEAKRGRYYRQRKRLNQSAQVLNAARDAFPESETVLLELQRTYLAEKWYTDGAKLLLEMLEKRPGVTDNELKLASIYSLKGLSELGDVIVSRALDRFPGDRDVLESHLMRRLSRGDLDAALDTAEALIAFFPGTGKYHGWQAKALRRMGRNEEALEALGEAQLCAPYSPQYPKLAGNIYHEMGDGKRAVSSWKRSLQLEPDDERLAHRLEHMSEEEKGAWLSDVPVMATVLAGLKDPVEKAPGANYHTYLDHEVTRLYPDGTASNVRTFVAKALNEAGRDRLTSNTLTGSGRKRILEALAITSKGEEIESSAIRGDKVRFRGLDVGSTIFLQYREDSAPRGFLAKYLSRGWTFHASSASVDRSEWVLWYPNDATLHLSKSDEKIRETREEFADVTRMAWRVEDIAPVLYERLMPGMGEVGHILRVSTVPGWEFFVAWEKALLENAFRSSPALTALADELAKGADSTREVVERLHEFVMQEIRYQQDYETHIAGVKPHSAPTVVERRYGDCKDKTVLMTTLAQHLGIDVHFALIRTRPKGPVIIDVPSQQFDHVIPYIPPQKGIEKGFFLDPTADALDLVSIRHDDVGTSSLVYDPKTGNYEWMDVPFQTGEVNYVEMTFDIQLENDGSATGDASAEAVGRSGSRLRVASRNEDRLDRVMEGLVGLYVPGSELVELQIEEVKDLSVPARVSATFAKTGYARKEGRGWRVPIPQGWKPANLFQKPERLHPMVLGVPYTERTKTVLHVPRGRKIKRFL